MTADGIKEEFLAIVEKEFSAMIDEGLVEMSVNGEGEPILRLTSAGVEEAERRAEIAAQKRSGG